VLHYSQDELGNVVALTDAGDPDAEPDPVPPAVVERYEYDPYGRTYIENGDSTVRRAVSKYGNPFAWTGQRYDAGVKLYGFFARAYSPELGRWLQRDPLGFVDGVNLYEYVRGMPTRLTDPLGLEWLDWVQGGLDVAGFIPVVGVVADVANAGISAARGDLTGAGINLVAAIPGIGDAAKGVKMAAKAADKVADAVKAADKLSDGLNSPLQKSLDRTN